VTRIIFLVGFSIAAAQAFAQSGCKVTKAQYDALKHGMSYAQVVSVLGCEGEELSSSEIAGFKTIMFMWEGRGFGANMNVMIQNDELVQKAQFGLR